MTDPTAILDYAGPRKRSVLRLAAVSRIDAGVADGRVTVVESLAGEGGATAALVFGAFVLVAVAALNLPQVYSFRHHHLQRDWAAGLVLPTLLDAGVLATMAGVLQQTWRQTRLAVEYDDVRLSFTSPFRRRHYRWAGAEIADVVVVATANVDTPAPLAEVLITRVAGGEIRLFTDHPSAQLTPIADAVHGMLRDGHADPIPTATNPPVPPRPAFAGPTGYAMQEAPPDLLPRAEQTAGRLAELRRSLRANDTPPPVADDHRPGG